LTRENCGHITGYQSLVTPYKQTRAGFLKMALEKNKMAIPFVDEARALKELALKAEKPKDLAGLKDIRQSLLVAAGVSDKALKYLDEQDKEKAILDLIDNFLEPSGENFIDELVYRFLLTKGDSLGGKMRNIAGTLGEWKFTRTLISTLSVQSREFRYLNSGSGKWIPGNSETPDIERRTKGLAWETNGDARTLLCNITTPVIRKNVDLCLFRCNPEDLSRQPKEISPIHRAEKYIALGEIKGGIDPAGADEHWKTAKSSLERIREGFRDLSQTPLTFFVGASIAEEMAKEILSQIEQGTLANAANLTNDGQLVRLCEWLVGI